MKIRHSVYCASLLCAFVLSVNSHAVERTAQFPVAEKQITSMGIQLSTLQTQSESVSLSLPAQTIVPPQREYILSAPLAGLPVQLFVQKNQTVKAGAPLLKMMSPEFGQLQLQLIQASSRTALARSTAKRERALFEEGIISQRRVEESQATLQESEAALYQTQAALALAGLSKVSIARIEKTKTPEDGFTLYAKKAGIVIDIDAKLGQRVEASSSLMHLAQTDVLWLDIQAPIADIHQWKVGGNLQIQGHTETARITSISPIVSASSQTVGIRAEVLNQKNSLRPGELLTVSLPMTMNSKANAWDVPLSAIAHETKQAYVFVRTQQGFEARPVSIVASAGQRVRITGALKANEKIAISGVVALKGSWLGEKGGE